MPRILPFAAALAGCAPTLLLAGCAGAVDGDTAYDSGWPSCNVLLEETEPDAGAIDHFYRDPVQFVFTMPDSTAAVVDAPVAGTSTWASDGVTLTFAPDELLVPDTDYTFGVAWCDGAVNIGFRTSNLGSSPVAASPAGKVYALSLAAAETSSSVGEVLLSYLTSDLLVQVTADDGDHLGLLVGVAVEGTSTQDYCVATDRVAADFVEDPWFEAGTVGVSMPTAGFATPFYDASLSAVFSADATSLGGGRLDASVDTRVLAALVDDSGDTFAICDLAEAFDEYCQPCPDGEPYCLAIRFDRLEGVEVPGPLVPIAAADCAGCASGPPAVCP